jgi:hypothetical protein
MEYIYIYYGVEGRVHVVVERHRKPRNVLGSLLMCGTVWPRVVLALFFARLHVRHD